MDIYVIIMTIIISFLITILLLPIFIPFLRRLRFGQSIREDGPESHHEKAGTPTMGGLVVIISVVITSIVMIFKLHLPTIGYELFLLLFVLVGFALIGFLDDFIKIAFKRNLGLTSLQKLIGQILIAVVFFLILKSNQFETTISVPGTDIAWDLGWAYALLVVFILVGSSNATNLTDGLDGLLSGTAAIAFGTYAIISWYSFQHLEVTVFALTVVGGLLGFLVFNAYPAKVFMGDTGSLALGGAIGAIAILTKTELLLIVIGGVFVIETLSVILQVISFKATGKRIFKMSPIHHHFELVGWSEWRVVTSFWFVGLIFGVIGLYIGVWLM